MGKKQLKQQIAQMQQQMASMQNQNAGGAGANSFMAPPTMQGQIGSTATTFHGDPGGQVNAAMYNPAQMGQMGEASNFGWDQLKALLSQPQGQPFNFQPVADMARRNFSQTTIPSIAERFSSLGTGGSQ